MGCIEAMLLYSEGQDARRALIVLQAHALDCSANLSVWWSGLGPRPRGWPFLRTSSVMGRRWSTQSVGMPDYYAIRATKKGSGAKHLPRTDKACLDADNPQDGTAQHLQVGLQKSAGNGT